MAAAGVAVEDAQDLAGTALGAELADGIGSRATMAAGVAVAGIGLAMMALLVSAGGYLTVLPGMLAMGIGTGSLPRGKQGVASALNDVTREFGTALGVAPLGALRSAGYRSAIGGRLEGVPRESADTAREGIANAVEVAGNAGSHGLARAAHESFVDGWQQATWSGAAVMGTLFLFLVVRGPRNAAPSTADDAEHADSAETVPAR